MFCRFKLNNNKCIISVPVYGRSKELAAKNNYKCIYTKGVYCDYRFELKLSKKFHSNSIFYYLKDKIEKIIDKMLLTISNVLNNLSVKNIIRTNSLNMLLSICNKSGLKIIFIKNKFHLFLIPKIYLRSIRTKETQKDLSKVAGLAFDKKNLIIINYYGLTKVNRDIIPVLAHEFIHSTRKILNRNINYTVEEVVADLTTGYLCHKINYKYDNRITYREMLKHYNLYKSFTEKQYGLDVGDLKSLTLIKSIILSSPYRKEVKNYIDTLI